MNDRQAQRAAAEIARRENDGLDMLRLLPTQVGFAKSTATEILLLGGNRGGKTLSAAGKFAAVARDRPLHGPDGEPIEQRLPWQKNRPLLMWIIGLQWDHIGDTIWRVLFEPGLYKILRDEETHRWRAYNPETDEHRKAECRPSFPLIPLSEVKAGYDGISWENKKEKQFNRVELLNGTVIRCWASTGSVKAGDPVDYIWPDEEIAIVSHYAEWQARLSDTKGRIVWSSLSYSNPALIDVERRAIEQAREVHEGIRDHADVEVFRLTFSANPHIDADEKRKRLEGWSEDERKMRDRGEFLIGNRKIYPQFDRFLHAAFGEHATQDDEISAILRERDGEPPESWTRDLILDPGTQKPGVLFGAVPPPELWSDPSEPDLIIYDEIYQFRLDAKQIAVKAKGKSGGYLFYRFIIDGQAARQKPMGFAGTVGANYSTEFDKINLFCSASGSAFTPGDPNFESRSQKVESALVLRPCGSPRLRIVTHRCPQLVSQLENNLRSTIKGPSGENVPTNKPAPGQLDDLRECLEYWLSRNPHYCRPEPRPPEEDRGFRLFRSIQNMFGGKPPADSVNCGPAASV